GIIRQLAPTYSCQFPAVLMYKLSCDHRVVTQLKSRTLGNSATQLVLTCSEGAEGLSSMAAGLMRRHRLAEVPPPQLIYVDRDCCNRDGVSKTAALFQEWGQLVVRLDIWHLMRRFAAGVTTESRAVPRLHEAAVSVHLRGGPRRCPPSH
ncbi:hypothetical protein JOQ06_021601, partial [Pogonophryne albipinna]